MSLQTRLSALITAIGADIKSLQTQINNLSASSGGSTAIEIDFGTVAKRTYVGTFAHSGATVGQRVRLLQSGDAPTGRQADENEMEQFTANGQVVTAGIVTVRVRAHEGCLLQGKFKLNYALG